jgi:hypothetical protein
MTTICGTSESRHARSSRIDRKTAVKYKQWGETDDFRTKAVGATVQAVESVIIL